MQIVKLSEYEAFMVGGYSTRHGASTHNWWLWSPESWRFEDRDLYLYRPHEAGAFIGHEGSHVKYVEVPEPLFE